MRKEQFMILTLIIAITFGAIVGWYYYHNHTLPSYQTDPILTDEEKNQLDDSESEECEEADEINAQVVYEPFEAANNITVEKVVRTTVKNGSGDSETTYDSYLVSDVDLKNRTDNTEDFSVALGSEEYDETKIQTASFADAFGFSYEGLSGLAVHDQLLKAAGFDGDLATVSFDEDTYKMTGQKLYILKDKCTVLKQLIPEDDSVNVLESKAYYQTTEDKDGLILPDYYVAMVRYQQGDNTIEKSLYLQITINNWEEVSDEKA